jgi:hypothetical protein
MSRSSDRGLFPGQRDVRIVGVGDQRHGLGAVVLADVADDELQ